MAKWEAIRGAKVIEKGRNVITGEEYTQIIAHVFGKTESQQTSNILLIAASPQMMSFIKGQVVKGNQDAIEFLQTLYL